ncbi:MAG: protein phosphatase 2C domain-containing protein [Polyangiaceae bacterium]
MQLPPIEFAHRTDPGKDPDKQVNEDASGHRETRFGHLVVVCDGMGGHEGGKEASNGALEAIFQTFDEAPDGTAPSHVLRDALVAANARVYALAPVEEDARPGSTVVAVLLHADGTEVAHVGDSRAYLIHAARVSQVTKDHSMVQQMVDAHLLAPEAAAGHPDANRISRALGMKSDVDVEVRPMPIVHVAGDAFLLCSDGLSDLVTPDDILQIVGTAPPEQAAGQLVDLANARGGHDNITVAILRARESALVHATALMPTLHQTVVDSPPVSPAPQAALPPARTRLDSSSDDGGSPRVSPAAILGILLGVVGLAIAGVAVYLFVAHPHKSSNTPVFVDAGFLPAVKAPSSVTVVFPEAIPDVPDADGGPSELTPLLPRPPTKRIVHDRH